MTLLVAAIDLYIFWEILLRRKGHKMSGGIEPPPAIGWIDVKLGYNKGNTYIRRSASLYIYSTYYSSAHT